MCQIKESNKPAPGRVVVYIKVHIVLIYTLAFSNVLLVLALNFMVHKSSYSKCSLAWCQVRTFLLFTIWLHPLQMREYSLRYAGTDRIKKSHYNIFTFNIKLRHLTQSWNKLFAIYPETFETLTKLDVLDLEGTNLEDVNHGCFYSLVNLEVLVMSFNHIRYMFESMYNVTTKLQYLDLCCNNKSFLPMNIFTSTDFT